MTAWEALRAALREAMRDGFANVGDAAIGGKLRAAVDGCLRGESLVEMVKYRRALEGFDALGKQDRKVLVARGMRLCATYDGGEIAVLAKKRRATSEPEVKTTLPRSRRGSASASGSESASASASESASASASEAESVSAPVDIRGLKGVGAATAGKLAAKGIHTVVDAAFVIPSRYEDRRSCKPIDLVEDGDVAVVTGTIAGVRQGFARGRFMASMEIRVPQPDGSMRNVTARWFHRVHGLNAFTRGGEVIAVGAVRRYKGQLTMAHPELRSVDDPGPAIAVRYPAVEGIAPRTVSRVVRLAIERLLEGEGGLVDALPRSIADAQGLPSQLEALAALHMPADDAAPEVIEALARGSSPAHRRLAFDEFFFFQLALLRDRAHLRERPAHVRPDPAAFERERLRACLPFEPTGAQWRVLGELQRDMGEGPPMLRLLQGDVGSGKTAVAFAAAVAMARSGAQTALMAPTEILADQHLRTLAPWCERAGLKIGLLTGATPKGARASLLALLHGGGIDLVVGTHALLTDDVHFAELGLVVVDEQHRFGVQQRAILRRKGEVPHLLVMTATPIPRTMALTAYGQLEVSVIDELPPGRSPATTRLFGGAKGLQRARMDVAKHVAEGHRAFVVCPLVEASDALEVTDVEATAAALRELMPDVVVEVIHGRMSSRDKDEIMARFRTGRSHVLVATTVIEVGVDVPDATVMMVEHAERFGLAQLHQLRGRVGRGGGASWCLLHTSAGPNSDVAQRLSIMTETADGFLVAERDLELRGPGEVLGTRQAGAPRLRFAGFAGEGTKLLVAAREAARDLLERDPGLRGHPQVRAELERRSSADAAMTADAG